MKPVCLIVGAGIGGTVCCYSGCYKRRCSVRFANFVGEGSAQGWSSGNDMMVSGLRRTGEVR